MKKSFYLTLLFSLSLALAAPKVVGYYPYWAQYSQFTAAQVRYSLVTHIHYNFVQPDENGDLALTDAADADNFKALIDSSAAHNVSVVLSLGGADAQEAMLTNSQDEDAAQNFATKILDFVQSNQAQGVELYWDISEAEDAAALSNLLTAVFAKFKPANKIVTVALFGNGEVYSLLSAELLNELDYISVIAIADMDDSQESVRPNSSGVRIAGLVQQLLDQGVNSEKIIPVVPFFGYSFAKATGFGSSFDGYGSGNDGYVTYNEMMDKLNGTDYKVTYDAETQSEIAVSSWEAIVFNGIPSVKAVAENAKAKSLGGVGAYDLSNDARHPIVSLLVTIGKVLRPEIDYKNIK